MSDRFDRRGRVEINTGGGAGIVRTKATDVRTYSQDDAKSIQLYRDHVVQLEQIYLEG